MPIDAIIDPAHWDDDLVHFSTNDLVDELMRLQLVIKAHRDIVGRGRTIDDDSAAYAVLPERLPADFRLPPEDDFIGGVHPGSGCPNFWKSHQNCPTTQRDVHHWGPCK